MTGGKCIMRILICIPQQTLFGCNLFCLQLNQHIMQQLSYTKSCCLTNTLMCFGTHCCHCREHPLKRSLLNTSVGFKHLLCRSIGPGSRNCVIPIVCVRTWEMWVVKHTSLSPQARGIPHPRPPKPPTPQRSITKNNGEQAPARPQNFTLASTPTQQLHPSVLFVLGSFIYFIYF